jgi:hypothetical protein
MKEFFSVKDKTETGITVDAGNNLTHNFSKAELGADWGSIHPGDVVSVETVTVVRKVTDLKLKADFSR